MRTPEEIARARRLIRGKYPQLSKEKVELFDEFLDRWATVLYRMFKRKDKS